jgi:lipoprotein-anchoring transpeptidase ErfK/SrfK
VRYWVVASLLVVFSLCGAATAASATKAARDREARVSPPAGQAYFYNLFGASAPSSNSVPSREPRISALAPATRSSKVFFGFYRITPREMVSYPAKHAPGTIIIKQGERRLYYILGGGQAIRYAIAVGREGAAWAGVSTVSSKREWPDWTPTPAILARQPDLPRHMEGGPANPLGARALYLGATLYRIHGTNEPWMIGESASAGCIRLSNADVIDLYERTRIGATVIVQH